MGRPQKPVEQQLAEAQAQRQKLDARLKALEGRKKADDVRLRAKGEKVLLRLLLDRLATHPNERAALLGQLAAGALKPEDHAAAMAVLDAIKAGSGAKGDKRPAGAVSPPAPP